MATATTAVWRLRTGGDAANGAGYDGTTYPGGTDYSRQDAAQLTLSDIACSNTTTVTSATGGFTAAMVGNAIRLSGGGAATGYYWITARASTNSITVDRAPGTVSAGSGRVGGACTGDPTNLAAYVVAGNTVYLRATAGNAASYPTTSLDYTIAAYATPTAGDTTTGWVRWVGEAGVPTIGSPGLGFYNLSFQSFEGLYFVATSGSNGTYGVLNSSASSQPLRVLACTINLNNQAATAGINGSALMVEGCEVYGGTASPTSSALASGIITANYNCMIRGNIIRNCRAHGIFDGGAGSVIAGNRIYANVDDGINASSAAAVIPNSIAGNTIDGNGGHGVNVSGTAGIACYEIVNNNITNHVTAGKYGINVADGTLAVNDRRKRYVDYNNLYGNTGAFSNISVGAHGLAVDPGYNSASTGDFTPSNAATRAAL